MINKVDEVVDSVVVDVGTRVPLVGQVERVEGSEDRVVSSTLED